MREPLVQPHLVTARQSERAVRGEVRDVYPPLGLIPKQLERHGVRNIERKLPAHA